MLTEDDLAYVWEMFYENTQPYSLLEKHNAQEDYMSVEDSLTSSDDDDSDLYLIPEIDLSNTQGDMENVQFMHGRTMMEDIKDMVNKIYTQHC